MHETIYANFSIVVCKIPILFVVIKRRVSLYVFCAGIKFITARTTDTTTKINDKATSTMFNTDFKMSTIFDFMKFTFIKRNTYI